MNEFTPLPEAFVKEPSYESVQIDEITYVKYKNRTNVNIYKAIVPMNMFIILLEGKKVIYKPKDKIEINGGEAFFIPKGSHLLSEILSDINTFESLIFFIDDKYMETFVNKHVKTNLCLIQGDDFYSPEIFKLDISSCHTGSLKAILPYFLRSDEFKQELFKLKLEEMLLLMLSTKDGKDYFSYLKLLQNLETTELATYMEQNYTKPYTVEQFAKKVGKSLSAYKREFKGVYNISPRKWIKDKRLNYSFSLLQNTDLSITDICYRSGYSSLPHFIKIFKEKFHNTPKKVQKQQKLNQ